MKAQNYLEFWKQYNVCTCCGLGDNIRIGKIGTVLQKLILCILNLQNGVSAHQLSCRYNNSCNITISCRYNL